MNRRVVIAGIVAALLIAVMLGVALSGRWRSTPPTVDVAEVSALRELRIPDPDLILPSPRDIASEIEYVPYIDGRYPLPAEIATELAPDASDAVRVWLEEEIERRLEDVLRGAE